MAINDKFFNLVVGATIDKRSINQMTSQLLSTQDELNDQFKKMDWTKEYEKQINEVTDLLENKFKGLNLSKYTNKMFASMFDDNVDIVQKKSDLEDFLTVVQEINNITSGNKKIKSNLLSELSATQLDSVINKYRKIADVQSEIASLKTPDDTGYIERRNALLEEEYRTVEELLDAFSGKNGNTATKIENALGFDEQTDATIKESIEDYAELIALYKTLAIDTRTPTKGTNKAIQRQKELLGIMQQIEAIEEENPNFKKARTKYAEVNDRYKSIGTSSKMIENNLNSQIATNISKFQKTLESSVESMFADLESYIATKVQEKISDKSDAINALTEDAEKRRGTGNGKSSNGGASTSSEINDSTESLQQEDKAVEQINEDLQKYNVSLEEAKQKVQELSKLRDLNGTEVNKNNIEDLKDLIGYTQRYIDLNGKVEDLGLDRGMQRKALGKSSLGEYEEEVKQLQASITAMTKGVKEEESAESSEAETERESSSATDESAKSNEKNTQTILEYIQALREAEKEQGRMNEYIAAFNSQGELISSAVGTEEKSELPSVDGMYTLFHTHPINENKDNLRFSDKDLETIFDSAMNEELKQAVLYCKDELLTLDLSSVDKSQLQYLAEDLNLAIWSIMLKMGNLDEEALLNGDLRMVNTEMTDEFANEYNRLFNGYAQKILEAYGASLSRQQIGTDGVSQNVDISLSNRELSQLADFSTLISNGLADNALSAKALYDEYNALYTKLESMFASIGKDFSSDEVYQLTLSLEKAGINAENVAEHLEEIKAAAKETSNIVDISNSVVGVGKANDSSNEGGSASGTVTLEPKLSDTFKADAEKLVNEQSLISNVYLHPELEENFVQDAWDLIDSHSYTADVKLTPVLSSSFDFDAQRKVFKNQNYSSLIQDMKQQMSSSSVSESKDIENITEHVDSLSTAFHNKTEQIVIEENQMRESASKEIQSIIAIQEKVELLKSAFKELNDSPIDVNLKMKDLKDEGKTGESIKAIKDAVNGIDNNDLITLVSTINALNLTSSKADNLQKFANSVLTLKSNLNNLSDSGKDFLTQINAIVDKADALKEVLVALNKNSNASGSNEAKARQSLYTSYKNKIEKQYEKSSGAGLDSSYNEAIKQLQELKKRMEDISDTDFGGDAFEVEAEKIVKSFQNISKQASEADKQLKASAKSIASVYEKQNNNLTKAGTEEKISSHLPEYDATLKEIKSLMAQIESYGDLKLLNESDIADVSDLQNKISDLFANLKQIEKYGNSNTISNMVKKMEVYLSTYKGIPKNYQTQIKGLINSLQKVGISASEVKKVGEQFDYVVAEINKANKQVVSFADMVRNKFMYGWAQTFAQFFSFYDIIRYGRELFTVIEDIDTAMTELRKVSNATTSELNEALESATSTAKELGASISDVVNAEADWSRLGYSVADSEELARVTQLYVNVGDNIDTDSASEYLISTLQGYQMAADQAESIVDKYNEVANNFAIDTEGIGEALERSAASFNAANTDLSQSIALVTTANAIVQDPESVGTVFKTLSARIRGASTELEDLGEEEDSYTKTTSKLQSLVKGLTGFDILEEDGQTFKSIYDILLNIGEVWDDLTDVEQASLGEALAGKQYCLNI